MIIKHKNKTPVLHKSVFVAPSSDIIGDVKIREDSSVWFNSVIRAEDNSIKIGRRVSVQDCCVLHVDKECGMTIGDNVVVGHSAVVHGCKIGSNCLIGINATVLSGANIGDNCVIGANALVTENMNIPEESVVLGVPGKIVKKITKELKDFIKNDIKEYVQLKDNYMKE